MLYEDNVNLVANVCGLLETYWVYFCNYFRNIRHLAALYFIFSFISTYSTPGDTFHFGEYSCSILEAFKT